MKRIRGYDSDARVYMNNRDSDVEAWERSNNWRMCLPTVGKIAQIGGVAQIKFKKCRMHKLNGKIPLNFVISMIAIAILTTKVGKGERILRRNVALFNPDR